MEEFKDTKTILLMSEDEFDKKLEAFYQRISKGATKPPKYVAEKVALQTLGLRSKTSLWKLRSEGKISYSKMGKIILYEYKSLMDYINEHKLSKF